jgi:RimK family alpha-L-glutamate ligase
MKILVAGLKTNVHLERFQEEGKKRGHQVDGCLTSELVIYADDNSFKPSLRGRDIGKYDLIFLMVSKRRWEWYVACYYLKETKNTIIVNKKTVDPNYKLYLSPTMNYLKQSRENLPFPKSASIFSEKSIESIINNFQFPLIVKASKGRQGKSVYKVDSEENLKKLVKKLLQETTSVIIREFIENDGDIRVFTVGFKAIGAMKRLPTKKGEFRSNISLGGKGELYDLKKYPKVKELAEKMSELTQTEVAGVDIIFDKKTNKPYILEVNPAPQFMGLEKFTGVNAAEEIIKYFEKLGERV